MRNYFIQSFKIDKLWGYRDIDLTFNNDVNILIGPNGSGKTTILNLLHSILTADIPKLLDVNFEQAEIKLKKFKSRSVLTITVQIDTTSNLLKLAFGNNATILNIADISGRSLPEFYLRGSYGRSTTVRGFADDGAIRVSKEFYDKLRDLVSIVWLPVSRYLSVTEEGEDDAMTDLEELLDDIFHYHSYLNTQLSKRYKEFEHQVLSAILYSKEHDQLDSILSSMSSKLPTKAEKEQLLGAFKVAGLLDEQMQIRINEHFAAAEAVLKRIGEREKVSWDPEDILAIPLILRTQNMMKYARKLEEDRGNIFAPLRRYEEIVKAFFNDKFLEVNESGEVKIELSSSSPPSELDPRLLSSGEKQILILLTEALLRVDKSVVYIADEPELSLHVTWQEKLLESLVTLGGQKQIIVATHSPDIVGKFQDKVIDLGGGS